MERINDAPWIRNPEPYRNAYYGHQVYEEDTEFDNFDNDYDDYWDEGD